MYMYIIDISLNLKANSYCTKHKTSIIRLESRENLLQLVCRFYPILSSLSLARICWNSLLLL